MSQPKNKVQEPPLDQKRNHAGYHETQVFNLKDIQEQISEKLSNGEEDEKVLDKSQEKVSPTEVQRSEGITGYVIQTDWGQKISEIFSGSGCSEFSQPFKACLLIFPDHQIQQILKLVFNNKQNKSLLQSLEKNFQACKFFRTENTSDNKTQLACIVALNTLLSKSGMKNCQNFITTLMKNKSLLNLKLIEESEDLKLSSKKKIIKEILSNQKITQYLKPKPSQVILEEKLRILISAILKNAVEPFTNQILKSKSLQFLDNLDKYQQMDQISLPKIQKNMIKSVVNAIPEYKTYVQSSQKDLAGCEFQFLTKIIHTMTFDVSFPHEPSYLNLKYTLIENLKTNPAFNIYTHKDDISKTDMNKIIKEIYQSLHAHLVQKKYPKPLIQRKSEQVDGLLLMLKGKIHEKSIEDLKTLLMKGNYIQFFKCKQLGSLLKDVWNKYKELPSCKEGLQKKDKDVEILKADLRWQLALLFGKYQIQKALQEELIEAITKDGNLLSIQRSKQISKDLCHKLLQQIEEGKSYNPYIDSNFLPRPLEQEVRWELIDQFINLPVGKDLSDLQQALTFYKVITTTEDLIESKSISSVNKLIDLNQRQRRIISKLLQKLASDNSKYHFKRWVCQQGIDIEFCFRNLSAQIYKILRRKHEIDCEDYQKILKALKETAQLECIQQIPSIPEAKKIELKNQLSQKQEFHTYKAQLKRRNLASVSFELHKIVQKAMPHSFQDEDTLLVCNILTHYLEFRDDLYDLGLKGSKPLKELLTKLQIQSLKEIMKTKEYQLYAQNFPDSLKDKQKQLQSDMDSEITKWLQGKYPQKQEKIESINKLLKENFYDIPKIRKIQQNTIAQDNLDSIEKFESVKQYQSMKFVKENRIDLIANNSYKKFVRDKISELKLLPEIKQNLRDCLTRWEVRELFDNRDLSVNQKQEIIRLIVGSKEFQYCSEIVKKGVQTKVQNLHEGIRKIITYCLVQGIKIDDKLKQLAKDDMKVQIQGQGEKSFPIKTSFNQYCNTIKDQIDNKTSLYRGEEKVTDENFQRYALQDQILVLVPYRQVAVIYKNNTKIVDLPLGKSIIPHLQKLFPQMQMAQVQLSDGTNPLIDSNLSKNINQIVVSVIKKVTVNGTTYLQKSSMKFGDLKKSLNMSILKTPQGVEYKDSDTLEEIALSYPNLAFKPEEPKIDVNKQIQKIKQQFRNPQTQDENDLWAVLGKTQGFLKFAYEIVFEERDMNKFITADHETFKKARRKKIKEFLEGLPSYNKFVQLSGGNN